METPIKHGMIWGFSPYFWKHPYSVSAPFLGEEGIPTQHIFETTLPRPQESRCRTFLGESTPQSYVRSGRSTPIIST